MHPTRLPECALEKLRNAVTGGLKTCEPTSEERPSEEDDDASVVDLVSPVSKLAAAQPLTQQVDFHPASQLEQFLLLSC